MNAHDQHNNYYIGLGSNIQPEENLRNAVSRLREFCHVSRISEVYKTHAEDSHGPDFLNAVLVMESILNPENLKNQVLYKIEEDLGRIRTSDKNAPRTIDLDILLQDQCILEPNIWCRVFIAVPLAELIPDFENPSTGENIKNIASKLKKQYFIQIVSNIF